LIDISERKQVEAQQQFVNRELAHRVKNTLTVVQAIVSQTLRSTADPKEAVHAINARFIALRDADEMLMSAHWDGAPITEIVARGFAVCGVDNPRIHLAGPNLDVGPKTTVALTMAIHELCTNAVKY
jgi:two-component sensor histidine kinase